MKSIVCQTVRIQPHTLKSGGFLLYRCKLEGKIEVINNLVKSNAFSLEEACKISEISVEEYQKYMESQKELSLA